MDPFVCLHLFEDSIGWLCQERVVKLCANYEEMVRVEMVAN